MASNTAQVMGLISAATTLIEHFPMSVLDGILSNAKVYNSAMEFIMDILKALGVDPMDIFKMLIAYIADLNDDILSSRDDFIERTENAIIARGDKECGFVNGLETAMKYVLYGVFSGLVSCSNNPLVSDKFLDSHKVFSDGIEEGGIVFEGGIKIPISQIDRMGLLGICPLNRIGRGYYSDVEGLGLNDLYRSSDMNAFIWYCVNKGLTAPQVELNKMTWDNRRKTAELDSEKWGEWLASKKEYVYDRNRKESQLKIEQTGNVKGKKRKPIFQLRYLGGPEPSLEMQFCSQTYYQQRNLTPFKGQSGPGIKINKTIFELNKDYLDSIKIFSSKSIIFYLFDTFFKGINPELNVSFNFNTDTIFSKAQIGKIVKRIIEADDTEISDCYFTFSNEEYDEMLNEMELRRYNAKATGDANHPAEIIDKEGLINKLDSAYEETKSTDEAKGDLVERVSRIENTFTEITASATVDSSATVNHNMGISGPWDSRTFDDLQSAAISFISIIVQAMVNSILTPKVLMFLYYNYAMMGYKIPFYGDDTEEFSWEGLQDLMLKNLLSVVVSLVKEISKYIVKVLLQFVYEKLALVILQYSFLLLMETLEEYLYDLKLILETCIPIFKFNNNVLSDIDDVDYADIMENYAGDMSKIAPAYRSLIPSKTTPNQKNNC